LPHKISKALKSERDIALIQEAEGKPQFESAMDFAKNSRYPLASGWLMPIAVAPHAGRVD
jgi:hypothetical protein